MFKILLYLLINLLLVKNSLASESIYNSNFVKIEIENINIAKAKILEIEKIKKYSLNKILKNILDNYNFKKIQREIDYENETNTLVKNINIENEFILKNKYFANIKVNFDKNEIIKLLRNNRVNYTDLESKNLLLVAIEYNDLYYEGLSKKNNFYSKFKVKNQGLLNFSYPELSTNDRFILPYNKILKLDLNGLEKISKKYNSKNVIIIKLYNQNDKNDFDISFYSSDYNIIKNNYQFTINSKDDYQNDILLIIDDWWKQVNIIDHSIVNRNKCFVKSSNIYELHYIIDKIQSISQIKSVNLNRIQYGLNLYNLDFYGDLDNLLTKLSNYNVIKKNTNLDECILMIKN